MDLNASEAPDARVDKAPRKDAVLDINDSKEDALLEYGVVPDPAGFDAGLAGAGAWAGVPWECCGCRGSILA